MVRDASHGTVILKAVDFLDPIEWDVLLGANWLAFNRRSLRPGLHDRVAISKATPRRVQIRPGSTVCQERSLLF